MCKCFSGFSAVPPPKKDKIRKSLCQSSGSVKECKFCRIKFKFSRIKSSGVLSSFSYLQVRFTGQTPDPAVP